MLHTWISRLFVLFTLLALSACAGFEKKIEPGSAVPNESRFYIDGEPVPLNGTDLLALRNDPERRNRFVDNLIDIEDSIEKIPNRDRRLRRLANVFKNEPDPKREHEYKSESTDDEQRIQERISGAGGFQVRLLLHYLLACSDDELRLLGRLKVVGKIEKWIYDQEATLPGDYKEDRKGSGYIYWHADADDCKGVKHDYKFHIGVYEAYDLLKNQYETGYELKFGEPTDSMIPKAERERIIDQERRFDYKLHATGSGIYVLTVFLDNELVDKDDPIYVRDADSCIDVFFKGEPPATDLPIQESYCMGRCDDPPIINTGGGD